MEGPEIRKIKNNADFSGFPQFLRQLAGEGQSSYQQADRLVDICLGTYGKANVSEANAMCPESYAARTGSSKRHRYLVIRRDEFFDCLEGKKRPERKKLFQFSVMLGLAPDLMKKMMLAADETPVLNWHNAHEIIAYFCCSRSDISKPEVYCRLCAYYDGLAEMEGSGEALRSKDIVCELDSIAREKDTERAICRLENFLAVNKSRLGGFSAEALEVFSSERNNRELTGEGAGFISPEIRRPEAEIPRKSVIAESFRLCVCRSGVPELDSLRLQPGRVGKLETGRAPVGKWDMLQLLFSKVTGIVDCGMLTEQGQKAEFVEGFKAYANKQLKKADLPGINMSCVRDFTILAALKSDDPEVFLMQIYNETS